MGRAAELIAPGHIIIREHVPVSPEPDEVRIAVRACGICGSDVQRFKGKPRQRYPIILGHEISGVIDAVGLGVSRFREGDPVVVAPLVPCHACSFCLQGDFGLCEQYTFIGSRRPGGFASTVVVPERNVLSLPDGTTFPAPALIEPLAVGAYALTRVATVAEDRVVVIGGGSIGLCAALMAKSAGVTQVSVLDVSTDRVVHAKSLGIDAYLLSPGADPPVVGSVVIEAAGGGAALRTALKAATAKGRIACVGTTQADLNLPGDAWDDLLRKQLTVAGVWNSYTAPFPGAAWTAAIKTLASRLPLVTQVITQQFPLERAQECIEWLLKSPGRYGKIVLSP